MARERERMTREQAGGGYQAPVGQRGVDNRLRHGEIEPDTVMQELFARMFGGGGDSTGAQTATDVNGREAAIARVQSQGVPMTEQNVQRAIEGAPREAPAPVARPEAIPTDAGATPSPHSDARVTEDDDGTNPWWLLAGAPAAVVARRAAAGELVPDARGMVTVEGPRGQPTLLEAQKAADGGWRVTGFQGVDPANQLDAPNNSGVIEGPQTGLGHDQRGAGADAPGTNSATQSTAAGADAARRAAGSGTTPPAGTDARPDAPDESRDLSEEMKPSADDGQVVPKPPENWDKVEGRVAADGTPIFVDRHRGGFIVKIGDKYINYRTRAQVDAALEKAKPDGVRVRVPRPRI